LEPIFVFAIATPCTVQRKSAHNQGLLKKQGLVTMTSRGGRTIQWPPAAPCRVVYWCMFHGKMCCSIATVSAFLALLERSRPPVPADDFLLVSTSESRTLLQWLLSKRLPRDFSARERRSERS
jgi:hypothetical protein